MTSDELEELLYRSEGTDLDFKQAQYRFIGATDDDKAELLKDILAMVNAWREGDAHILIGVRDARPNPAELIGISELLDDALLQQFVNSKTSTQVVFKYEVLSCRGLTVAAIRIPKQHRPVFLKKGFGKLSGQTVYVRRGSSTAIADPSEIARMGSDEARQARRTSAELRLLSPDGNPPSENLVGCLLDFGEVRALPSYESPVPPGPFGPAFRDVLSDRSANSDYWRELAAWAKASALWMPIRFELLNTGPTALSDCMLEVVAHSDAGEPRMRDMDDMPELPAKDHSRYDLLVPRTLPSLLRQERTEQFELLKTGVGVRCQVRLDKLLPSERRATRSCVALIPTKSCELVLESRLLARELERPIEFVHRFHVELTTEAVSFEALARTPPTHWSTLKKM